MSGPEDLTPDQRLEQARSQAQFLLDAAAEVRGVQLPGATATGHAVHGKLVEARGYLDRLEVVWISAMTWRDNTAIGARKLEQAAADAWDDLADQARRTGSRGEYEGAQERYATWRLKTRSQIQAARTAREIADIFAAAEKVIAAMYRGLDGTRMDLHRRLSAIAFEDSLSR